MQQLTALFVSTFVLLRPYKIVPLFKKNSNCFDADVSVHTKNSKGTIIINYDMAWYVSIFLGLLQGLTEFLPVSSSGHLMMFQHWLNMPDNMLMFNIVLHLATLAAVVLVFRKKIWSLIQQPLCRTNLCLILSTLITCAFVLVFKDFIDSVMTYKVLPITFMVTAIVLFLTSLINTTPAPNTDLINENSKRKQWRVATAAGIAQGIAVVPGISRSGSTIAACLFAGAERKDAAEFSFLMSIPIIVASFLFELIGNTAPLTVEVLPLILAFAAAFISGIIAIKIMLAIVQKVKLYWFSVYLVLLSMFLLFI